MRGGGLAAPRAGLVVGVLGEEVAGQVGGGGGFVRVAHCLVVLVAVEGEFVRRGGG